MQRLGLATLGVGIILAGCSVYQSDLLEEAAGFTGSGSNGGGAPSSEGGKSAGGKSGDASSPGGTGEPLGEAGGGAGDEAGGAPGSAGTPNEPTAGTGGMTSGAGGGGGSAGGGGSPVVDPTGLLDGFEDGDLTLERSAGRGGVWYLFNDGSVGTPGPKPLVTAALASAPAVLGDFAMHITATGFTGWGSGLGVDFRAGKKLYDGSKLTGVSFWAKVGEGKNKRHRLQLVDATTDALGGKCNPAANAPDGQKCDDHFGKDLLFTTTWTLYVVPFTDLGQIGFGTPAAALDKANLYGLQVTAPSKVEVDLWIDQFELL